MTISTRRRRAADAEGRRTAQAGYSVVELTMVVSIVGLLSAFALFELAGHRQAFRTDDQSRRILDFMRDASQRALVQRQLMRLEIDIDTNTMRIIDENAAGVADDAIVRREALPDQSVVRLVRTVVALNGPPTGVIAPPAPSNYNAAAYGVSTHPLSLNSTVSVMRFRPDGTVVDNANNVTSLTLYLWEPSTADANIPNVLGRVRAVTVFGGTGGIRLWKYNGNNFIAG